MNRVSDPKRLHPVIDRNKRQEKSALKVCVVSTYPPIHCGVACTTYTMCEAFINSGIKIDVLANEEAQKFAKAKVIRAWKFNNPFSAFRVLYLVLKSNSDLIQLQFEYLLYGKPICALIFTTLILLMLKTALKPITIFMHSVLARKHLTKEFFVENGVNNKVILKFASLTTIYFTKFVCSFADKIIVYTNLAKRILFEDYGIPTSKIIVIQHPALDVRLVDNAKVKLGLDQKAVLMFFGYLRPKKGLKRLIEAAIEAKKAIPNLTVLIVGGAHASLPYIKCELEKYCNESNNLFIVTGYIPDEELPIYFSAADAFVFPYEDVCNASASNAMCTVLGYGKPIIATDIPKFYELKEADVGILVPPYDSEALANAIISAFNNYNCTNMRLIDFYRERQWGVVVKKFIKVYEEVLRSTRRKRGCRN